MGTEQIVEKILSDAKQAAAAIVTDAENKAAKLLADASLRAEALRVETENEVAEKRKSILEKRAADARLDGSKLLLKEKRKVLDALYDEALGRLLEASQEEQIRLVETLLEVYAEEGDEVCFANNFRYQDEVKILPIVAEKKLSFAGETLAIDGGLRLRGKISDKDLSFGALLAADRENYQADLAAKIFK
jgi:V/A-type H+-transporting ATPase subunit E